MKKLIFLIILALWIITTYTWEFKGQNRVDPRIAGDTPQATAYDALIPINELGAVEPKVIMRPGDDLRVRRTIENDDQGYRSSVFDAPAMTR